MKLPRRRVAAAWLTLLAASFAIALPAAAVEAGAPAPAFSLARIDGGATVSLADLKGKVVLVDFWASWCGPCRQSLPLYNRLHAEFPREDFDIVAINLDEDLADAKTFLSKHPIEYTTLQNPQGDVAKAFDLKGMPSSYLIDRAGIVRARRIGFEPQEIEALRSQIAELTGKAPHAP